MSRRLFELLHLTLATALFVVNACVANAAPGSHAAAPAATLAPSATDAPQATTLANPAIDMDGYLRVAGEAAKWRESHRVSEEEFLRLSREPGTIVLDARSQEKFDELHVKGALHLAFSDIAVPTLEQLIPDRNTRILIYCNNNFRNAPGPFPSKLPSASLNLSTFIALYNYGYKNVWELAPLVDLKDSKLEFESARQ